MLGVGWVEGDGYFQPCIFGGLCHLLGAAPFTPNCFAFPCPTEKWLKHRGYGTYETIPHLLLHPRQTKKVVVWDYCLNEI